MIAKPVLFEYTSVEHSIVAAVAQLVECELPKLEVAGSNPVRRSISKPILLPQVTTYMGSGVFFNK